VLRSPTWAALHGAEVEELHESGAAPYSDSSCLVVSLASTSLTCFDQTAHQLHPLQLLAHT